MSEVSENSGVSPEEEKKGYGGKDLQKRKVFIFWSYHGNYLQCFDTVGWAAGRASGL